MAITVKRKSDDLTEREKKALQDAGLLPAAPVTRKLKIMRGFRVVVNHELFDWIPSYKKGDTGVVTHVFHPVDTRGDESMDLISVELDNPRTSKIVDFRRWELDLA